MGEIKIIIVTATIKFTREFINRLLKKGVNHQMQYMILCMALSQYLAVLYADVTRAKVRNKEEYYTAFPRKAVNLLPKKYRFIGNIIVTHRNLFCHELGSTDCMQAASFHSKYVAQMLDFVEHIVMNDSLLQKDTVEALSKLS